MRKLAIGWLFATAIALGWVAWVQAKKDVVMSMFYLRPQEAEKSKSRPLPKRLASRIHRVQRKVVIH